MNIWRKWPVGLAAALMAVLALALGVGTSVFAAGPTRVSGGGQATAASFVTYNTGNVPSIGTIGNRITFGFNGTKDGQGNVRGHMQLVDHNLGMTISSDVGVLSPDPRVLAGATGVSYRMESSTSSVVVNGAARPGWQLKNVPVFDGGEPGVQDTVCFELFDASGAKVLQWSAIISSGNVQVKP